MKNKPECKRCGYCCFNKKGKDLVPCKNLINEDGIFICKVYPTRFDKPIDSVNNKPIFCMLRTMSNYDYPDCPYNDNKPLKFKKVHIKKAIKEVKKDERRTN